MNRRHLLSVIIVCLVCFGAFAGVYATHESPLLGLDLRGGLSVVYCQAAKHSTTSCASGKQLSAKKLNTVVNIMDNRANALGVAQPNIDVQGNDVVVQLPGIKNARKAEKVIGTTAQLYFRPVLCFAPAYAKPSSSTTTTTTPGATTSTTTAAGATSTTTAGATTTTTAATTTTTAGATTTTAGATTTTTANAASSATTTTTTQPAASSKGENGYVTPPTCPSTYVPTASGTGSEYSVLSAFKSTPVGYDDPSKVVLLSEQGVPGERLELGPAQAKGQIIASAVATYQNSGWAIDFTLTGKGTPIWDSLANKNYHKLVADDLGGTVISAPSINAHGSGFGNKGEVTGTFTKSSASDLALDLNYGALPITLHKLTSEVVSPSLGSSSLHAGLLAGLLGLVLVMIYTIFYYRALGIVVVLGLVSTAAVLYAIISALGNSSFLLTLDLSGVTGLIVSVGITVDSYVVYFERLKDEVRAGRSVRASVDRGFKSAYRTILSADAVSLIGAVILWWLSVGDVKGFAFMLGLSTIIDVITAYFFTRPLVILLGRNRMFTEARGFGIARGLALKGPEAGS